MSQRIIVCIVGGKIQSAYGLPPDITLEIRNYDVDGPPDYILPLFDRYDGRFYRMEYPVAIRSQKADPPALMVLEPSGEDDTDIELGDDNDA